MLITVLVRKNECLVLQNKKLHTFLLVAFKKKFRMRHVSYCLGLRLIWFAGLQLSPGPLSLCVLLPADLAP